MLLDLTDLSSLASYRAVIITRNPTAFASRRQASSAWYDVCRVCFLQELGDRYISWLRLIPTFQMSRISFEATQPHPPHNQKPEKSVRGKFSAHWSSILESPCLVTKSPPRIRPILANQSLEKRTDGVVETLFVLANQTADLARARIPSPNLPCPCISRSRIKALRRDLITAQSKPLIRGKWILDLAGDHAHHFVWKPESGWLTA